MAQLYKRNSIYHVRYKDIDGKWKMVSCGPKITTKKEADHIAESYTARELNHRHQLPIRLIKKNLNQAFEVFEKECLPIAFKESKTKRKSSVKREATVLKNFKRFLNEKKITQFHQVNGAIVKTYLQSRKKEGVGSRTIQEEIRVLKKFYNFAIDQSYQVQNPMIKIQSPEIKKKKPRFFSLSELQTIFTTSTEPYSDIFKFLFYTGLRTGELRNLEFSDFNKEGNHLVIRILEGNKTTREEVVPLSTKALKIVKKRLLKKAHEKYLFVNEWQNQLDNDNIYRNLKRVLIKNNILSGSPHTFRHSTASHLVINGVSIYTVKEILRHKSVKETEIYAHLAKETIQKAINILNTLNINSQN